MNVAVHDAKMALGVFLGLLVASSLGLLVLGPITYNKQITLNDALAQARSVAKLKEHDFPSAAFAVKPALQQNVFVLVPAEIPNGDARK